MKISKERIESVVSAARVFEENGLIYGVLGWQFASAADFAEYLKDPDKYEADYEGVSVEAILRSRGRDMLRCSHILKSGRACRNYVQGMHSGSSPKDYERLSGGYCCKHGG